MIILKESLTVSELKEIAQKVFGDLVKGVVDVDRDLVAIDAELHSDLESLLLENGSHQENLWGINLYPDCDDDDFLEFDSMINMRPSQGNMSRGVDNEKTQMRILEVINHWIKR